MTPFDHHRAYLTRRQFFGRTAVGIGAAVLGSLLNPQLFAALERKQIGGLPGLPHFAPKAKRVIYLLQNGAPSHVDLFDYKPDLKRGEQLPDSVRQGQRLSTMTSGQKELPVLPAITTFQRHGQSGATVCNFMPHIASIADDVCFIKSMHTEAINHAPAITFFLTGAEQPGRPSLGAWATYGLGSESQDLPAYVVFSTGSKGTSGGASNWGSGFLPSIHQGTLFRSTGDPVLYLSNPKGVDAQMQRDSLDAIQQLNQKHLDVVGDPEIATRINSYEMAYRMQSSAPELMDLAQEPKHILDLYGAEPGKTSFANSVLLARRLVERGVRFVQIFHEAWDQHGNLVADLKKNCKNTDRACAALIQDLKQRGLLEDTLVIWGGEFGRTPMVQGGNDGRDHHPNAFTMWMAGGGVKPGLTLGESDEFGFNAVRDKVHVHDLHATLLHLLGFNHEKLTYRFQGRDFRLTDVAGEVVEKMIG